MEKSENKKIRNMTMALAKEGKNVHLGTFFTKPSLTVEGMAEPMSTILERFQRGQEVYGTKIYYDSEVNDLFEKEQPFSAKEYDLSDIDKAREDVERIHKEAEEKRQKELKAKQDEADEKRALDILAKKQEKEKQQQEQQQPNNIVKTD